MADFDDSFGITDDVLTQLENIEISLLNSSFHVSSEDESDYQLLPTKRNWRRIVHLDIEHHVDKLSPDKRKHQFSDNC